MVKFVKPLGEHSPRLNECWTLSRFEERADGSHYRHLV